MKFVRGTAQELINWQKTEGYGFPVVAIVDNLNPLDIADVMKDGGAVNIIQRPAMDKQLVETVGRYARPVCKYSLKSGPGRLLKNGPLFSEYLQECTLLHHLLYFPMSFQANPTLGNR